MIRVNSENFFIFYKIAKVLEFGLIMNYDDFEPILNSNSGFCKRP